MLLLSLIFLKPLPLRLGNSLRGRTAQVDLGALSLFLCRDRNIRWLCPPKGPRSEIYKVLEKYRFLGVALLGWIYHSSPVCAENYYSSGWPGDEEGSQKKLWSQLNFFLSGGGLSFTFETLSLKSLNFLWYKLRFISFIKMSWAPRGRPGEILKVWWALGYTFFQDPFLATIVKIAAKD